MRRRGDRSAPSVPTVGTGAEWTAEQALVRSNSSAQWDRSRRENRNSYSGEFNHYEKLKHNNSGIPSGLRHDCVASSKSGQNFGGNGSSDCDVAGGKSLDWS